MTDLNSNAVSRRNGGVLPPAVEVRSLRFAYGGLGSGEPILKRVNFTVKQKGIYSLLGASGCGKTTLLRCVVGRLKAQDGTVKVFGAKPGTAGSPIPGPGVGYMPQEIGLFTQFTIQESLHFFGRLYMMTPWLIRERSDFLLKLLNLPDKNRLISKLSGGQQRRVSLAIALIHNPPLAILDEPTVGVDPLLRERIWQYLIQLCKGGLTVIITTHYIEEARAADMVAFMRAGRLLSEGEPNALLQHFNSPTLEEVFLKIVHQDEAHKTGTKFEIPGLTMANEKIEVIEMGKVKTNGELKPVELKAVTKLDDNYGRRANGNGHVNVAFEDTMDEIRVEKTEVSLPMGEPTIQDVSPLKSFAIKTKALCGKNFLRMSRRKPALFIDIMLPSIQIILFCVCIGRYPTNIPIAVHNAELDPPFLSRWLLSSYDHKVFNFTYFNNTEDALDAVRDGKAWAALYFPTNYSKALQARRNDLDEIDNATLDASNLHVFQDMSNRIYSATIRKELYQGYQRFAQDIIVDLEGDSAASITIPMVFEEPIYGEENTTFIEFMAPGIMLTIAFFATMAMTSVALVTERKEGSFERTLVAGVTPWLLIVSQVLSNITILLIQVCLMIFFGFIIFDLISRGSIILLSLLVFMTGFAGAFSIAFIKKHFSKHSSFDAFKSSNFCRKLLVLSDVNIAFLNH